MQALVLKSKGVIEYIDKDEPELKEEHGVLLEPVLVSPCTSDVHTIWYGSPKKENLTLGHECVARIKEIGRDVHDFKVGDIVAVSAITPNWGHPDVYNNPSHAGVNFSAHALGKSIDGAFQEVFYLPYADKNLAHIPENVTLEQALMCVDVVTTGFTAVEDGNVSQGDTVLVMGIGAIGLSAIMDAKLKGAKKIYAIGSRKENVEIAEGLGAEVLNYKTLKCELPNGMHPLANYTNSNIVNYILKETNNKGVDSVLICGGNDNSFSEAIDVVKYGTGIVANVMYYGSNTIVENGKEDALLIPKFSIGKGMAGKTLKFSLAKGGRERLEEVLKLCSEGKINPEIFITKRYDGINEIKDAIYDLKDRKAIKISVKIDQ